MVMAGVIFSCWVMCVCACMNGPSLVQVPGLRADYEREVTGMQRELDGLKQLVSAAQDRHKREVEKRHRAEQTTSRVRQGREGKDWE